MHAFKDSMRRGMLKKFAKFLATKQGLRYMLFPSLSLVDDRLS
jgi:hypothetical protein